MFYIIRIQMCALSVRGSAGAEARLGHEDCLHGVRSRLKDRWGEDKKIAFFNGRRCTNKIMEDSHPSSMPCNTNPAA